MRKKKKERKKKENQKSKIKNQKSKIKNQKSKTCSNFAYNYFSNEKALSYWRRVESWRVLFHSLALAPVQPGTACIIPENFEPAFAKSISSLRQNLFLSPPINRLGIGSIEPQCWFRKNQFLLQMFVICAYVIYVWLGRGLLLDVLISDNTAESSIHGRLQDQVVPVITRQPVSARPC